MFLVKLTITGVVIGAVLIGVSVLITKSNSTNPISDLSILDLICERCARCGYVLNSDTSNGPPCGQCGSLVF